MPCLGSHIPREAGMSGVTGDHLEAGSHSGKGPWEAVQPPHTSGGCTQGKTGPVPQGADFSFSFQHMFIKHPLCPLLTERWAGRALPTLACQLMCVTFHSCVANQLPQPEARAQSWNLGLSQLKLSPTLSFNFGSNFSWHHHDKV